MSDDKNRNLFAGCLVALALGPFLAAWNGYVLSVMYGWFIGPTFHAPHLGIANAVGISYIVAFLTAHKSSKDDQPAGDALIDACLRGAVTPTCFLAFGWIVMHWM